MSRNLLMSWQIIFFISIVHWNLSTNFQVSHKILNFDFIQLKC